MGIRMSLVSRDLLASSLAELERLPWRDEPIPRLIHMTAREVPTSGVLFDNLQRVRAMNPGWSLRCYADEDMAVFLREHIGDATVTLFERINPRYGAARADLFRYLCVLVAGGLYLDIKSTTACPVDEWLLSKDRFIVSQWWNDDESSPFDGWGLHDELVDVPGGEYQQWFLLSSPGHPYLKSVATGVLQQLAHPVIWPPRYGRRGVLLTTGPIVFSRALHSLLGQYPHRKVDVERDGLLRYSGLAGVQQHLTIGGTHYSLLTDPVVQLPVWARTLYPSLQVTHAWLVAMREGIQQRWRKTKRFILKLSRGGRGF